MCILHYLIVEEKCNLIETKERWDGSEEMQRKNKNTN
jgi:hypothetical protein